MKRLESLDILRGMDLFLLTVLGPIVLLLAKTGDYSWESIILPQFRHADWAGFTLWDIIMPLFMFMAGATIPFSLEKYRTAEGNRFKVYSRIFRRFIALWILGMIVQGHLLDFDWSVLRFFSNTLQAIAVGYLFSALFFLWFKPGIQIGIAVVLLTAFWILCMTSGHGDFSEHGNICEIVDNTVLGSHRDQAAVTENGEIVFNPEYSYTWILSSINFIVTVMTGTFAGMILKTGEWTEKKKILTMLSAGTGMVVAGWLWGLQMPVIKKIWTSSMVLVSSGYCFLLLATVYYVVDYRKKGRWLQWFKIWGMNSILAYVMHQVIKFTSIPQSIFHGLEQFTGPEWYRLIIGVSCALIEFIILRYCYKNKIYLKV